MHPVPGAREPSRRGVGALSAARSRARMGRTALISDSCAEGTRRPSGGCALGQRSERTEAPSRECAGWWPLTRVRGARRLGNPRERLLPESSRESSAGSRGRGRCVSGTRTGVSGENGIGTVGAGPCCERWKDTRGRDRRRSVEKRNRGSGEETEKGDGVCSFSGLL